MSEKLYWAIAGLITAGLIFVGIRYYPPLLTSFHILVSLVLMVVILLQSGRAADLAGAFGGAGSQTAFGPRGAATFLSNATEFLAVVFMVTSLALATVSSSGRPQSIVKEPAAPTTQQTAPAEKKPAPSPPAESPPPAPQPQQ